MHSCCLGRWDISWPCIVIMGGIVIRDRGVSFQVEELNQGSLPGNGSFGIIKEFDSFGDVFLVSFSGNES